MANSLSAGRATISEEVKKTVYGCTLCGLCDVSCKYNTDIEVFETLLLLRRHIFEKSSLLPEHKTFLAHIKAHHHPIIDHVTENNQASIFKSDSKASKLLWVGPHFAHDKRLANWLRSIKTIIEKTGITFKLLYDLEPYTGRAALELGDFNYFEHQSKKVGRAIEEAGVKEIVCLSAEDYSTLRSQTPKFAAINLPIKHIVEFIDDAVTNKLVTLKPSILLQDVAWHDPCYLGRLGGKYQYWQGNKQVVNGLPIYKPARPINYGCGGVFEAPRRLLKRISGFSMREFSRRNEYSFNAGESGQAHIVFPEFCLATAKRRLQEAEELGIRTVVTECPQAYLSLKKASTLFDDIDVFPLSEIIVANER